VSRHVYLPDKFGLADLFLKYVGKYVTTQCSQYDTVELWGWS